MRRRSRISSRPTVTRCASPAGWPQAPQGQDRLRVRHLLAVVAALHQRRAWPADGLPARQSGLQRPGAVGPLLASELQRPGAVRLLLPPGLQRPGGAGLLSSSELQRPGAALFQPLRELQPPDVASSPALLALPPHAAPVTRCVAPAPSPGASRVSALSQGLRSAADRL